MGLVIREAPDLSALPGLCEPSVWATGNQILYDLCALYPDHIDLRQIIAKVWLIGRSYAASVERGKSDDRNAGDFYSEVVAPALRESTVDSDLAQIGGSSRIIDARASGHALATHQRLTRTFQQASGRANRSLASKYLHFHRPNFFPIYDSRANERVRQIVGGHVDRGFPPGDSEYRPFLARALFFRDFIEREHGLRLTMRELDRVLLRY